MSPVSLVSVLGVDGTDALMVVLLPVAVVYHACEAII